MTKKWVFESLVTDDRDAVGLIAYALYKNKKHTLASNLRSEGKAEDTIQQEVNTFHDQTLQNNSLVDYREKATNYLSELIQNVQNDERVKYTQEKQKLEQKHQKEKKDLGKEHEAKLKKQKTAILKNMREYQGANRTFPEKTFHWLASGLPGIVSSFLITCLIIGASVLLVSEDRKQEVFTELASKYFGISAQHQKPQPTKP